MKYIKLLENQFPEKINKVKSFIKKISLDKFKSNRICDVDLKQLNIVNNNNKSYLNDSKGYLEIFLTDGCVYINVDELEDDYYKIYINFPPTTYICCYADQLSEVKKIIKSIIKILITE